MVYLPNIPQPTDNPSTQSQAQFLENFTQLNTQFGIDHSAFNAISNNGLHKKATIVTSGVGIDPLAVANAGIVFTKSEVGGTTVDLFYRTSGGNSLPLSPRAYGQCTNAGVTYGYNIASITNTGAGYYTIAFTTALANLNYMVFITADNVAGGGPGDTKILSIGSKTVNGFQIFSRNSTNAVSTNFNNSIDIMVIGS
jgi:hypothetical protein